MPCSPKNDPLFACLVLERGAPYEKGACFLLRQSKLTLGRSTSSCTPDITFDSLLISRKHCCIEQRGEGLVDMRAEKQTRHAAERRTAAPVLIRPLKHGIKSVWRQTLSLRFSLTPELDQTLDYNCADPLPGATVPQPAVPVVIDTAKKSLLVGGAEVTLSAKEWLLLELVYKHRNELVTYDSIHDGLGRTRLLRRQAARSRSRRNKPSPVQTAPQTGRRCEYPQNPPRPGLPPWKSARRQYCFRRLSLCNETVIRPLYFFRPAIAKIKARKNYTEECSDEKNACISAVSWCSA